MPSSASNSQLSPNRSINTMLVLDGGHGLMINRATELLAKVESPAFDPEIEETLKRLTERISDIRKYQDEEARAIAMGLAVDQVKVDVFNDLDDYVMQQIKLKFDAKILGEKVDAALKSQLPSNLMKDLREQKAELQRLQNDLRNSQSKCANGLIRSQIQFDEPLHPIVNREGASSKFFPNTVKEIFFIKDDDLKELAKFYGLNDKLHKLELINEFMVTICGLGFQFPGLLLI